MRKQEESLAGRTDSGALCLISATPTIRTIRSILILLSIRWKMSPGPSTRAPQSQRRRKHATATIQGGKLHIVAADGVNFKMGADSTGLMRALGLNTFFQRRRLFRYQPQSASAQEPAVRQCAQRGRHEARATKATVSSRRVLPSLPPRKSPFPPCGKTVRVP